VELQHTLGQLLEARIPGVCCDTKHVMKGPFPGALMDIKVVFEKHSHRVVLRRVFIHSLTSRMQLHVIVVWISARDITNPQLAEIRIVNLFASCSTMQHCRHSRQ
jgi:hypothetical protein